MKSQNLEILAAVLLLVLMAEWERRARYAFGRVRQRAHFDVLHMIKLPPTSCLSLNFPMEPLTPYIPPEERKRMDALTLLKQTQHTIDGQSSPTAVEQALIKLIKEATERKQSKPT